MCISPGSTVLFPKSETAMLSSSGLPIDPSAPAGSDKAVALDWDYQDLRNHRKLRRMDLVQRSKRSSLSHWETYFHNMLKTNANNRQWQG